MTKKNQPGPAPGPPSKRWTPEEEERLKSMIAAGESKEAMVTAFGRTLKALEGRAKRFGLKLGPRKEYTRQPPWTEGEIELLKCLIIDGRRQSQILRCLRRTEQKTKIKCRELNLPWRRLRW